MNANDDFGQIIAEMIASAGRRPIAGARARILLERIAQERGVPFPPPEMVGRKFYDFLEHYQSIISLRKRPHQDFLIAPADQPGLLASEPAIRGKFAKLRVDIYEALTKEHPDGKKAFYLADQDAISWRARDDSLADGIELPAPVSPIELRRAYAEANEWRDEILGAIESETSFSKLIRSKNLGADWIEFRLRFLIDRLKDWSDSNGIPWGHSWIEDPAKANSTRNALQHAPGGGNARDALAALRAALTEDDLRRITVPLDIVLKLLEQQTKG